MVLPQEEVDRLAVLTRLALNEEEKWRLAEQLGAVLEYVDRLAKVDTQGIPEAEMLHDAFVGRVDELVVQDPQIRECILENFPDSVAGALRVPAVFEKPKG